MYFYIVFFGKLYEFCIKDVYIDWNLKEYIVIWKIKIILGMFFSNYGNIVKNILYDIYKGIYIIMWWIWKENVLIFVYFKCKLIFKWYILKY